MATLARKMYVSEIGMLYKLLLCFEALNTTAGVADLPIVLAGSIRTVNGDCFVTLDEEIRGSEIDRETGIVSR